MCELSMLDMAYVQLHIGHVKARVLVFIYKWLFCNEDYVNRNKTRVERWYLSPKLGRMTAISLPLFSGREAIRLAAVVAAPHEIPTSRPSSSANLLAMAIDSSLDTYGMISIA